MKVHKPNTDQTAEVWLSNGDKVYSEYIKEADDSTYEPKPNIFESFIPVNEGDQITVNINFGGTVLHGAADVIADGAFVYDRRIEGDRYGCVKYQKRHWKIEQFYNVPGSMDTDAMHTGQAIVGGHLLVKPLHEGDQPLYPKGRGKLGLGSLAVIISINQDNDETYAQSYGHSTIGRWRNIRANQADGGIKPMHELEFRMEDDEVHFNRQQRHKRHLEQTRFGLKPWAVFVFFYRSQTDIQSAGCTLRPKKGMLLDPFIGEFTFADPDAIMKKRLATRAKNEREKQEALEEDFGYDGYDTNSNAHSVSDGEGLFVSRSPSRNVAEVPRKRLLGNSLGFQNVQGYAPRKDSSISEREAMAASQGGIQQANDGWQELFGDAAAGDNIALGQPEDAAQPANSISATNQADDFDFNFYPDLPADELTTEIDQALQAGGFDAQQAPFAAPAAKMGVSSPAQNRTSPIQQPGYGDVAQFVETPQHQQTLPQHHHQPTTDQDDEEHAEPSQLAQLVSSAVLDRADESKAAKTARLEAKKAAGRKERPPPAPKGKPIFDPTAKTGYGFGNPKMGPKPMAPTQQAMQQLHAQDTQMQGMLQNYLQSQAGFQQYASPPTTKQQAVPYQRPWETAQPRKPAQYPMSPPNKIATPNVAAPSMPPASCQAQPSPHTPAPAPAIQRKRSVSITSRDSASSKKSRVSEMSARKAAILARLEETRKAKDAEQQKLEDGRRAREEMDRRREEEERRERQEEEAEEAEIARLEAELAGEGAEVEAIQETGRREAEEAKMRELEREREGEGEE